MLSTPETPAQAQTETHIPAADEREEKDALLWEEFGIGQVPPTYTPPPVLERGVEAFPTTDPISTLASRYKDPQDNPPLP